MLGPFVKAGSGRSLPKYRTLGHSHKAITHRQSMLPQSFLQLENFLTQKVDDSLSVFNFFSIVLVQKGNCEAQYSL